MSTVPLIFTGSAARKVKTLIDEEGNPNLNLRVFITGGGCSGFQYGFMFDETIADDDVVVRKIIGDVQPQESHVLASHPALTDLPSSVLVKKDDEDEGESGGSTTVNLLIDCMSFQYLKGAEIDYREDINGSQFIIRNPNAKTTCGCGSSFST